MQIQCGWLLYYTNNNYYYLSIKTSHGACSSRKWHSFIVQSKVGMLYAKKGTTTALYQWVLVTEAGGYNLYTRLTTDQKRNACDFIKKPWTTCPSTKEWTHFFDRNHIVPIAHDTELFALRWCRCWRPRNVWDEDEYAQQIGRNAGWRAQSGGEGWYRHFCPLFGHTTVHLHQLRKGSPLALHGGIRERFRNRGERAALQHKSEDRGLPETQSPHKEPSPHILWCLQGNC